MRINVVEVCFSRVTRRFVMITMDLMLLKMIFFQRI